MKQGLIALKENRLPEARASLEQATRLDPKNAIAWTSLAGVYSRLQLKSAALAAAKTAEQTGAANPVVLHALALFYSDTKDLKHAAELEEQYARISAKGGQALGHAAALYLDAGDAQAALRVATELSEHDSSAAAKELLGRAAWAAGQPEKAIENFAAASKAEPSNGTYAFDYAQILFRKGDFGRAADVIESALAANADDVQLQLALGVARYGQRRFDDAAAAFLKTIAFDPSLPQPYEFLGKMLDQVPSRLPEITRDYEARFKREPGNYAASFLLAKVRIATNADDAAEVERLLRESIIEKADFWESHFELGQELAKSRRFPEAAAEFNTAIRLNPKEPMPHYHLARVYDRLGDSEKAKTEREIHARLSADQKGDARMP